MTGALEHNDYDEFQFLEGHARWAGLPWAGRPPVERDAVVVDGRTVSFVRWGAGEPELVLLHGGGQNAHVWDTFAMALGRPAVAVDLPGHGRSDWRDDRDYSPWINAVAVAEAIERIAPHAVAVTGMSLGGLTAIRVAATHPGVVCRLILVDITPSLPKLASGAPVTPMNLMGGPRRYDSWEAMLDATHAHMPHRNRDSIIPGLRHNAKRHDDGSWGWRYDQLFEPGGPPPDHEPLWDDLETSGVDLLVARGEHSPFVPDEAIAELRRRVPSARVETVAGSGHSVQSDAPVALAQLVNDFAP